MLDHKYCWGHKLSSNIGGTAASASSNPRCFGLEEMFGRVGFATSKKSQRLQTRFPESIPHIYPLVNIQKAFENGQIVSFPINSMVDLSIVFC